LKATRPRLSTTLHPREFAAWYWLRSELADFCRQQGLQTSGTKEQLAQRIAALLRGEQKSPTKALKTARGVMPASFSLRTRIGPGWRCSRELSEFLKQHCGRGFRFNAPVRDYVHHRIGATLAEVVKCYQLTAKSKRQIEPQFEYNRHVRDFYRANPGASKQQMLEAWWNLRGERKE